MPPEGMSDLILSLPPIWHRGKTPVLFKIPYTSKDPERSEALSCRGDDRVWGGHLFGHRGRDRLHQDIGYSSGRGLLQKSLSSRSTTPSRTRARRRSTTSPIIVLLGAPQGRGSMERSRARSRGCSSARRRHQSVSSRGRRSLEAGATLSDYVLFETPSKGAEKLTFEYPASLFEARGIARVSIRIRARDPGASERNSRRRWRRKRSQEESE